MNVSIISRLQLHDAEERETRHELVLGPTGDLCYENAHRLTEAVMELLAHSPRRVSLDLGQHGMIDSSGIRALLQSRQLCEEAGADFHVAAISDCAARTIRMSGFDALFGIAAPDCRTVPAPRVDDGYTIHGSQTYECVASSDPMLIPVLREKVARAALEAGASADVLCDVKIAVGEALTNAYKHGSPNKGTDRITVRCTTAPNTLIVEIEDEGACFDADDVPDPDPTRLKPHGMGIYLMRQTMDEVTFSRTEKGNRVRMARRWGQAREC